MMPQNMRNFNTTVLKTISVLNLFNDEQVELGLTSISEELDIPISTTHRIVSTLVYAGFMSQNRDNGKYRLGMACYRLGKYVKVSSQLKECGLPFITELSKKYNEAVNILSHDEMGHLVVIKQIRPARSVAFVLSEKRELQVSASGKCMMACMEENELNGTVGKLSFAQYTPKSISSKEQLFIELAKVRAQGFAIEAEEGEPGTYCCAAPIMVGKDCVATVSISLPIQRRPKPEKQLIEDVMLTAKKISTALCRDGC